MIGFLKSMVEPKQVKPNRGQVLGARPMRNPAVKWETAVRTESGGATSLLEVPRRKDRLGNFVAKLLRLPDYRKLELDEIGSDVWERCDGDITVEQLTKQICEKYKMNRRQGETSVTAYLRMLAERRLIALKTGTVGGSAAANTRKAKKRK